MFSLGIPSGKCPIVAIVGFILFLDIKPMTVFIKPDQSADPWVFPDSKLSLMGLGNLSD